MLQLPWPVPRPSRAEGDPDIIGDEVVALLVEGGGHEAVWRDHKVNTLNLTPFCDAFSLLEEGGVGMAQGLLG